MRINHCVKVEIRHDLQHMGAHADLVIHLLQITGGADLTGHGVPHIAFAEGMEQSLFQDLRHAVDLPVLRQGGKVAVQIMLKVVQMDGNLAGQPRLVNVVGHGNQRCAVLLKNLQCIAHHLVGGFIDLLFPEQALQYTDAASLHALHIQVIHIAFLMAHAPCSLGVIGVIALNNIEAADCVLHGAADGTGGILRQGIGHNACAGNQTDGGTDPDQAVGRGGGTHRVDGVGAQTDDADIAGNGSAGAAGGTAGGAGGIVGVHRLTHHRADGLAPNGKLVQIGLGKNECARLPQLLGHKGVFIRHPTLQRNAAGGGGHIGGVKVILQHHRDSVQRSAQGMMLLYIGVKGVRLLQRLGIDTDDGIDGGTLVVICLDTCNVILAQLAAGQCAVQIGGVNLCHGGLHNVKFAHGATPSFFPR